MRVLLVEDEEKLSEAIRRGLARHGYAVDTAIEGIEGHRLAASGVYDLLVLDLNLPGMDGVEICRSLRAQGIATPVLMLTARRGVDQRVEGLDSGADDYLTKPFAFEELLARLRALRRRSPEPAQAVLTYADLALDPATMVVTRAGRSATLRRKEFMILELLLRRAGQVVRKDEILEHAWDRAADPRTNVVEAQIKALRKVVDPDGAAPLLHTVRGVGYQLAEKA